MNNIYLQRQLQQYHEAIMTTLNYIHTLKDKQGYIGTEELQAF